MDKYTKVDFKESLKTQDRTFPKSSEPNLSRYWILATEKLPNLHEQVICSTEKGRVEVAEYVADEFIRWEYFDVNADSFANLETDYGKVIAWMPLPEPYKKSDTKQLESSDYGYDWLWDSPPIGGLH